MSLGKYYDIPLAANDAAAYTACLRLNKKLIFTAYPFKLT